MYANPLVPSRTCTFCHKIFSRGYDLKRHQNTVHTQEEDQVNEDSEMDESIQSDLPESEKERTYSEGDENGMEDEESSEDESEYESSEDESSSDLEDNPIFQYWLEEAKEATNDKRNEKYEKYIDEGMSEEDALEKAAIKIRWAVKRNFFARFKDFLTSHLHLRDNDTFQEVVEEIEGKVERGMDVHKAMSRVIPKYTIKFNGLFDLDERVENAETDEEIDD